MLNTKNIVTAFVLLFSASSAFAGPPVCDGSIQSGYAVNGYFSGTIFHYSQKIEGSNSGSCILANGCDGWIEFTAAQCSDGTTSLGWQTLNYGPGYDNTLVDALYHAKQTGKLTRFVIKQETGLIMGIYTK